MLLPEAGSGLPGFTGLSWETGFGQLRPDPRGWPASHGQGGIFVLENPVCQAPYFQISSAFENTQHPKTVFLETMSS